MHFSVPAAIALLPLILAAPASHKAPGAKTGKASQLTALAAPQCNITNVAQPPNTLTPPTPDMSLALIALAEGTQNYTCGANATAAPAPDGAKANLYDATCAVAANATADPASITSDGKPLIGMHFFVDTTTADFNVSGLGNTQLKKAQAVNATCPTENVQLVRLVAQTNTSTSNVKQIYRLNTQGGVAPSNCSGRAAGEVVTVRYSAQYWFYT